ncbi:hypothetical protein [Citrobacter koseri]|uniref:hypothetical protein n=1 Tax=Citrobacter koseri TaxID=545 RepID=UPI0019071034|nr:hypothetical protein [Citrobacter koseri]MBJ8812623.1 hypothetical protein [Citrobacter koseri]
MKPTYEELEAKVKQLEADNEKAMSVLKEANDAVLLAKSKFEALAAENAGLKAFGDKLYSMYKGLETSGGGFHDEQSIPYQQAALDAAMSAFEEIETPATSAFLTEVRAHDINAFIQHHSAELDAHIKNGGEQFDEKSVRIRNIIVSARLFREQIRKGVQS